MKKTGPFLMLLACSVLVLGVLGCSETSTTTTAAPSDAAPPGILPSDTAPPGIVPSDTAPPGVLPSGAVPSTPATPIGEQEIKELAASALGTSAADVDVYAYENFQEWSAAAVFPVGGEAGQQAVFYWAEGTWSLFWLQSYTVTAGGTVEFEDPSTLLALGVPQAVIDWLNLDM